MIQTNNMQLYNQRQVDIRHKIFVQSEKIRSTTLEGSDSLSVEEVIAAIWGNDYCRSYPGIELASLSTYRLKGHLQWARM